MRIPGVPFHQGRNDYTDADGLHYGIAIHNTSNTASDEAESSYADHRTDGTSSHFYVDSDSVTQSLDTNDKAGHAGSKQGNENAIAFEITGTNDKSRDWWLNNVAWAKLGYVIAYILQHDPDYAGFQVRRASVAEMQSNPRVKAFYSHNDMRLAWGGTTHDDPGPNFPWDRLFTAVTTALTGGDDMGDFDPYGKPAGNPREIGVYAADVWGQEMLGTSPYGVNSPSPRTQLLGRLEAKLDATLKALGVAQADLDDLQSRPAPTVDLPALAAALAPLLAGARDAAAVLAVLQSPEGQEALVTAVNKAEDS